MKNHENIAHIKFMGSLQDFVENEERKVAFHLNPSAKDLVESCGVPHVEIFGLVINGKTGSLDSRLQNGDEVGVYPKNYVRKSGFRHAIKPPENLPKRFIADVHLGKLARLLRLHGFDTAYSNIVGDKEIVDVSIEQERAVLTRDVGLLKHGKLRFGYWLRSDDPDEQIMEVLKYFELPEKFTPFSRCISCNGTLQNVAKEEVEASLPPRVRERHNRFQKCKSCGKVYWKGSHYEKLLKKIRAPFRDSL